MKTEGVRMIDKSEVSLAPGKHSKINQNKTIHSTFFPTVLLFSAKYVNSQFLKRRIAKKSAQRIKKMKFIWCTRLKVGGRLLV